MSVNHNDAAKKGFVERLYEIERTFADAKAERNDLVKDLATEIKSRFDETGVDVKEVKRLVAIRLEEQASRDKRDELVGDLETYEVLFGRASNESDDDDVLN